MLSLLNHVQRLSAILTKELASAPLRGGLEHPRGPKRGDWTTGRHRAGAMEQF